MNLHRFIQRPTTEPGDVRQALARRFERACYQETGFGAFSMEVVAYDDTDRARIRIPFFYSEARSAWVFLIQPGDRK